MERCADLLQLRQFGDFVRNIFEIFKPPASTQIATYSRGNKAHAAWYRQPIMLIETALLASTAHKWPTRGYLVSAKAFLALAVNTMSLLFAGFL